MKLQAIDIFGYGKFVHRQFQLTDDFNVFLGPNGSGKSTLMSFVLSIMFGFPNQRRKGSRDFDTNDQVRFGGRLYFKDTQWGDCAIERTRANGKQVLKMSIAGQEAKEVDHFKQLFGDLTRDTYLAYFGFTEPDLMQFIWESEEDFARSLVNLGVTGKLSLSQEVDQLQADADSLYRPQGQNPKLNQEMVELERQNQDLAAARQEEDAYFDLDQELSDKKAALAEVQSAEQNARQSLMDLEKADQQSASDEERVALGFELAQYDGPRFSDQDVDQWQNIVNTKDRLVEEYQELNPEGFVIMDSVEAEAEPEEELNAGGQWISDHLGISEQMLAEARAYREQIRQNENLHDQIVEKRYQESRLLSALGAETIDELPRDFTNEERDEWQKRQKAIDSRRVFYKNTKAGLENLMEDRESLGQERQEISSNYDDFKATVYKYTQSWIRPIGMTLLAVGIICYAISLFHTSPFWRGAGMPALILGLIFVLIAWFQERKGKHYVNEEEKAYQLDLRDIDSETAEIQRQIDNQNQQIAELEEESKQFTKDLEAFLQAKGGSSYIMPLVWLQTDYVKQIEDLEGEINQLIHQSGAGAFGQAHQAEWSDYRQASHNQALSLDSLFQQFEDDYHNYRLYAANLDYEDQEQKAKQARLSQLADHIDQLEKTEENFLKQYNLTDRADLEKALTAYGQFKDKEARYQLLNQYLDKKASALNEDETEVSEQIKATKDQINSYEGQRQVLLADIARIENQLKQMKNSQALQAMEQDKQEQVDQSYDTAVAWASDTLAAKTMEEATLGQGQDTVQRVLAQANRYLFDLTNTKFEKMRYTDDSVEVYQPMRDQWTSVNQLSRGEKALLFVAMRFAFLDAQLGHQDLPILIDEGFAHLDQEYRQNIYRFLKEKSLSRQIIVFTFDQEITQGLHSDQVHYLEA
ncbi:MULTISPECIES: ATP-binding protein [Aerococcus]|uniref:ATP-binding protein n=1 Tax=Aerococcus TaxID=1375 RepID=UPI000DCB847C|nr:MULTISPECIES: AAA family ATPase [Aerococcus]KAA9297108.1 AAA family ATPase [Aerococcus tenax]MDK6688899.1 AAA family ATPase [Aerococcus urinae]WIW74580.1 AAA family ATPase [Aerococcus tenax]